MKRLLLVIALLCLPALATEPSSFAEFGRLHNASFFFTTNYTVKTGGGGDFTTIQACANAMSNGDTCTVFVGTYAEHVTLSAGGVASYKTFTVNTGDTVNVLDWTAASHTKIIGFSITNPSSPNSSDCVLIPAGATDIYITSNTMYACGVHAAVHVDNAGTASYVYLQGNAISYPCSTSGAPNVCGAFSLHGNHMLVENSKVSHVSDVCQNCAVSQFVFRNNPNLGPFSTADCGSHSANCHIDLIETEPSTATTQVLVEGNTARDNVGSDGHAFLMQGDGCAGFCHGYIARFNDLAHFGSGGILDDNAGNILVNPGFYEVKVYNNTFVDFNAYGPNQPFGGTNGHEANSTYSAELNNIFYYPESLADFNPYVIDASSSLGAKYGYNLAWCTGTTCNLHGHVYGSGSWTEDAGNLKADPLFVNYAGNDFHLQVTSPARLSGTHLTSAVGCSGSVVTVADADFFQDGYGLAGVAPDVIRIGASSLWTISTINYATNQITTVSPVSCSPGDVVDLYSDSSGVVRLFGAVPDMGAYPYAVITNGSVQLSISGAGSVTSSPAGISCSTSCNGSFTAGTSITLTAAPGTGQAFAGWSGASGCTGTSTCALALTTAGTYYATATFVTSAPPVSTYPLSVSKGGTGTGTVTASLGGISCGSICSANIAAGASVTVTIAPDSTSSFLGWSGCSTAKTASIAITMSASQLCTASLKKSTKFKARH